MKAKKSKESPTKKIKKNQQKFKLDMTFEDAMSKIVSVPPKNSKLKDK
jgi:hypothetical protein